MQLPIPRRHAIIPPGIPKINWADPLAYKLDAFFFPSAGGGKIYDLVRGLPLTVGASGTYTITQEGRGVDSNGTAQGTNATAPSYLQYGSGGFSIFFRGYWHDSYDTYTGNACPVLAVTFANTDTSPFTSYGINSTFVVATSAYGFQGTWATGSTASGSTGGFSPTLGTMISCGASFTPGASALLYGNGILQDSTAFGVSSPTYSGTAQVAIGTYPAVPARASGVSVTAGAIWGRALTAAEQARIAADPYCMLLFPDDYIYAQLLGPRSFTQALTASTLGLPNLKKAASKNLSTTTNISSTPLDTETFESGSVSAFYSMSGTTQSSDSTRSAVGTKSWRIVPTTDNQNIHGTGTGSNYSEFSAYFWLDSSSTGATGNGSRIFGFEASTWTGATGVFLWVTKTAGGYALSLARGSAIVATTTITTNTWNFIRFCVYSGSGNSTDHADLWLNGIVVQTLTGMSLTVPNSNATWGIFGFNPTVFTVNFDQLSMYGTQPATLTKIVKASRAATTSIATTLVRKLSKSLAAITNVYNAPNSITNPTFSGNVPGIPGTDPTNMSHFINNGLTYQTVGSGIENGMNYLEIRFSGTTTNSQNAGIIFTNTPLSTAFKASFYSSISAKLTAGSFANISSASLGVVEEGATFNFLNGFFFNFTPTTTIQQVINSGTFTDAGTLFSTLGFYFNPASSIVAIDFTIRLYQPIFVLNHLTVRVNKAIAETTNTTATIARKLNKALTTVATVFNAPNSITNPTFSGNVPGTPGTDPTSMSHFVQAGLSFTNVGTGVEAGLNYIEMRFNGTATSNSNFGFIFNSTPASTTFGRTWYLSMYAKITTGSLANISGPFWGINTFNGGSQIGGTSTSFTPTTTLQQFIFKPTVSDTTANGVELGMSGNFNNGAVIDVTIRFYQPTLVFNRFNLLVSKKTSATTNAIASIKKNLGKAINTTTNVFGYPNSITNTNFAGNVSGTPGTDPTGMSHFANGGLTYTNNGVGIEAGKAYVEARFFGTPNATSNAAFMFTGSSFIPAAAGEIWNATAYIKLQAGSTTNLQFGAVFLGINEFDSGFGFINSLFFGFNPTGTIQLMNPGNITLDPNTAFINMGVYFNFTNALPIDVTLRYYLPILGLPNIGKAVGKTVQLRTELLNPSDANSHLIIPASQLSVTTATNNVDQPFRALVPQSTGKWYFEATMNFVSFSGPGGGGAGVGFANATKSIADNSYLGIDNNGVGIYSASSASSNISFNNTVAVAYNPIKSGDTVGVAVDLTNRKLFLYAGLGYQGSNQWNAGTGDPNTNTGGLDISAMVGAIFPAGQLKLTNESLTFNFGGSPFAYSIPTGYSAWGSAINASTALTPVKHSSGVTLTTNTSAIASLKKVVAVSKLVTTNVSDTLNTLKVKLVALTSNTTAYVFPANVVLNTTFAGAVPGTPGLEPTNMSHFVQGGLSYSVVGTGIDDNLPYLDLRFFGTTTGTQNSGLFFNTTLGPAIGGQTWNAGLSMKVVAGSMANISSTKLSIIEYNNGSFTGETDFVIVPTAIFQNFTGSHTIGSTTNGMQLQTSINYGSGVAIDVTLRYYQPVLGTGLFNRIAVNKIMPSITSNVVASKSTQIKKSLLVSTSVSVTLVAKKLFTKTLTASTNVTASMLHSIKHNLTASTSVIAAMTRNLTRTMSATVPVNVSLVAKNAVLQVLTASINVAATISRRSNRGLSANVNVLASKSVLVNKILIASTAITTSLAKVLKKALAATINVSAALRRMLPSTLTTTVSIPTSIVKRIGAVRTVMAVVNTSLQRLDKRSLQATAMVVATLSRIENKILMSTTNVGAAMSRVLQKKLQTSISVMASQGRAVQKTMAVVASVIATVVQSGNKTKTLTATMNVITPPPSKSYFRSLTAIVRAIASVFGVERFDPGRDIFIEDDALNQSTIINDNLEL